MRTIYLVVGLLAVLSVTGHVSAQNTKDVAEEDSPVHTILIMNKDLLESMKQRAASMEQMMGRRAGAFHAHHVFPGRDKSAGEPHGFKKDPASDDKPETTRAFPGFGVRAEPLKTKPEEPRATAILASSAHVDRSAAIKRRPVDTSDSDSDSDSDAEEAVLTTQDIPELTRAVEAGSEKEAHGPEHRPEERPRRGERPEHRPEHGPEHRPEHGPEHRPEHGPEHHRRHHFHGEGERHGAHHHRMHAHPHRPCLFRRAKHWFKQVMGAPPQHPRRPEAVDEEGPLRRGPPPPPSAVDALLALLVVLVPIAAGSWLIFHGVRSLLHCSRRAASEPQFMSANPGLVYASQHAYQALPAKEAAV